MLMYSSVPSCASSRIDTWDGDSGVRLRPLVPNLLIIIIIMDSYIALMSVTQ